MRNPFYQADAEDIPSEVSDEALETAAGNEALPAWTNICSASAACPASRSNRATPAPDVAAFSLAGPGPNK